MPASPLSSLKVAVVIFFGTLLCLNAAFPLITKPAAKFTVRVLDEQGVPVRGAKVVIGFQEAFSDKAAPAIGETDANGCFSAQGYSAKRLAASVTKAGYYESGTGWTIFKDPILGKWQPWNPVAAVVLRPIGKPVALAAKRVKTHIPALDQACGYDLEKGDWVQPYGKGTHADFSFKVHRDYKDWFNFSVDGEVTFAQPHDGLVRMKAPSFARNTAFFWERCASETGYTAPHIIRFVNHNPKTDAAPERSFDMTKENEEGYFFRVRTVEESGKVTSINYGKIAGDIGIDPRDSKTCQIFFTYYFNPEPFERNLEWNPKRNLIEGLSPNESPHHP